VSREPEAGQASIEVVAAVPIILVAALVAFQLLVAGYTHSVADGAAEAGALAAAAGAPVHGAVQSALPRWARDGAVVSRTAGRVAVSLPSPSPLDALGDRLRVRSEAWARPAAGEH
jgi:hypothetical protein